MASRIVSARLTRKLVGVSYSQLRQRTATRIVSHDVSLHLSSASPRSWYSTAQSKDERNTPKKEEPLDAKKENESFQETVNRLRGEEANSSSEESATEFRRNVSGIWSTVSNEVGLAWQELVNSGERKSINKKIHPVATAAGEAPYTGPVDIMVIDPSENLTAWERMQKRLTDAPIIQDMLNRSEEIYENTGARKAKERLDEIKEDAREAWETSQNPWVYRVSSVYDTLTAETAESIAVKELRELDPEFTLDDWKRDVVEHTLPQIMQWFLEGRTNQLKDWFGDGVFKRVAAEIAARKKEGVEIDTHVLGVMNSEILAVEPDTVEKGSPIIMLHFMVQQINCVRKKEDGSIVEGSEDDIRANSYVAAFQREYREAEGELVWKIIDFRFNGAIAYL
mmetsp:Transcript_20713/g.48031  ORF Transcript_20713/g.48031 Transcript_20713/m.48031 type:complete len:395 (+) Transcript_20713:60-1244(+)